MKCPSSTFEDNVEKKHKQMIRPLADRLKTHHGNIVSVCVSGQRDPLRVSAIWGHTVKHECLSTFLIFLFLKKL